MRKRRDLVEIFGYAPTDITKQARTLWQLGACPFINKACIKFNHDQSIIYGTCSVTSPYGDVVICPNRLYADEYKSINRVAIDAFGDGAEFLLFNEYIQRRAEVGDCIVALGKNSGREVQVGNSLSMDWVLAHIIEGELKEYAGVEVQSIDITGNYRDAWHSYNTLPQNPSQVSFPSSQHGLNWANVHKRLIPQLIRKGVVYSRSSLVTKGFYFIVPDIVYRKFEELIGDIPVLPQAQQDAISVFTYTLGNALKHGEIRKLCPEREIRFRLNDFAERFIQGPNLPSGSELDQAVKNVLGIRGKS